MCRFIDELKHDANDDVHEKKMKIGFSKRLLESTVEHQKDEERQWQVKKSEIERQIGRQLQAKGQEELQLQGMPENIAKLKEKIQVMKKDGGSKGMSDVAPFEEALEHYEQTERLFRMQLRNINSKLTKLNQKLEEMKREIKLAQDSRANATYFLHSIETYYKR